MISHQVRPSRGGIPDDVAEAIIHTLGKLTREATADAVEPVMSVGKDKMESMLPEMTSRLLGQRLGRREHARELVDRRRQVRKHVLERRLERPRERRGRGLWVGESGGICEHNSMRALQ